MNRVNGQLPSHAPNFQLKNITFHATWLVPDHNRKRKHTSKFAFPRFTSMSFFHSSISTFQFPLFLALALYPHSIISYDLRISNPAQFLFTHARVQVLALYPSLKSVFLVCFFFFSFFLFQFFIFLFSNHICVPFCAVCLQILT